MQKLTAEWVEKAEEDFISAQREYRARNKPNYNAACFFSQQGIEKYLKACLQEAGIEFSKTHDLVKLLDMIKPVEPLWQAYSEVFRFVSAYAVDYRYPGESSTKEEALEAIKIYRGFRKVARLSLRLKE